MEARGSLHLRSMQFRTFHNADPPHLAALWRTCDTSTGLCRPMTASLLEDVVFAKGYFDHAGLIVAEDQGRIIGFIHAGFGFNDDCSALDPQRGVISMLIVHPRHRRKGVGSALLARAEQYLAEHGATTIQGGEWGDASPFYAGLYGQSACPGILKSAEAAVAFFLAAGYEACAETRQLRLELPRFRPPLDRRFFQMRRMVEVYHAYDPVPRDWWEASRLGVLERVAFELVPRSASGRVSKALFWYHEPAYREVSGDWVGLIEVTTLPDARRRGYATFLLAEAFKHLSGSGFQQIAAVCQADNAAGLGLLHKLGFEGINQGIVFSKRCQA